MRRPAGIPPLGALTAPPLVLAYHALGDLPADLDPYNLMVTPERFREQIVRLRARGYAFVPLTRFAEHLAAGRPPARICALTFDDGSLDNLTVLAPLLEELELPATIFACPGLLGTPHFAFPEASGVRLMNAEELRQMADVPGVEIGSHTVAHVDLDDASAEEAEREMREARVALEQLLQRPIETFAYPRCGYSNSCPDAARAVGYSIAVTCGGRGGWLPHELTRESIDALDGRLRFALKSRRLFWPLRNSLAGRLGRRAARRDRSRCE